MHIGYIAKLNVPKGGLVCPACRKDITRVLANSSHVPRWTKLHPGRECCVQECSKNVFASLHKITSDEVRQIFDSGGLKFNSSTIPVPVPLCKHHYQSNVTKTRALCDMWDITETGF